MDTSLPDPAARRPLTAEGASPAMAQWFAAKADHPDALLFFRMGDFFEMFFADAEAAAEALDIALTYRGEHQGQRVAMCGVPAHSHESYLARLIRRGFRVAICEQMETPEEAKRRKAPTLHRQVVRLVTPGTVTEEGLLDAARPAWLLALAPLEDRLGAAWLDLSTGAFETETLAPQDITPCWPGSSRPRAWPRLALASRVRRRRGCRATAPGGWPRPMGWRRWTASANTTRPRSPPPPWRWTISRRPRRAGRRGAGASLPPGAARQPGRAADGCRDPPKPGDPPCIARQHA